MPWKWQGNRIFVWCKAFFASIQIPWQEDMPWRIHAVYARPAANTTGYWLPNNPKPPFVGDSMNIPMACTVNRILLFCVHFMHVQLTGGEGLACGSAATAWFACSWSQMFPSISFSGDHTLLLSLPFLGPEISLRNLANNFPLQKGLIFKSDSPARPTTPPLHPPTHPPQLPPISLLVKHLYWACICTTFAGPGRSTPNNDGCVPKPRRPQPSESRRGEQRFFVSIRFMTDFTQQRRPTATATAAAPAPLLHFAFTLMTLASPAIEWEGASRRRERSSCGTQLREKKKKKKTRDGGYGFCPATHAEKIG